MAVSLLIIADDFTGACDTGLQFARNGLRTVACETDRLSGVSLDDVDVLVCDTETRNASRAEARGFVTEACGMMRSYSVPIVYKKVDSALRGHIAAEIHTVMVEMDFDLAILAPAFPQAGRVTVGGYHLVHGVPVGRSEVGHDAGAPVRGSYLPHLLDNHPDLEVRLLALEDVSQGPDHVSAIIESHRDAHRVLVVADAASDDDLSVIAEAASRMTRAPLLCGSAGLASHVSTSFDLTGSSKDSDTPADGPALVIVGTHESMTRDQVAYLKRTRAAHEWEVHANHSAFAWERPHVPAVVAEVSDCLAEGRSAILSLVGLHAGMQKSEAEEAMRVLGEMGRRIVSRTRPAGLIVSGGWTAIETLRALDASGVQICEPIDVGTPLCKVIGGLFDGLDIITKGGALGEQDTLDRAVACFEETPVAEKDRPILAITMGDVCGVGPEVIAKGMVRDEVYALCRPVIIGDIYALEDACRTTGVKLTIKPIDQPGDALFQPGIVEVLNPLTLDPDSWQKGQVSQAAGGAAAEWVIEAVSLAMANRIDGIVTAPLNKEAMNSAGYTYPGHTELLAEQAGGHDVRLMLAAERMSVAHVTGHIPLHEVSERLTQKRVYDTIVMTREALVNMGKPSPKLAVTGLNPHAGENGLFGEEDDLVIRPAVEQGRSQGWDIDGPLPADATYFKAYDGEYDGVVTMYHDQGHAPMKLVAFDTAVNVTLGLPIVRTSVDHGTAFDIAGTGTAKEGNLIHAIRVGARLATGRKKALADK
jgi:4-phospho-D-threonate 3-dehydrogenase / 4-phospho-D-erythronate 3-dehydrogenase